MQEVTTRRLGDRVAEFQLPEGCALCGQDLSIRVTPEGAMSVCTHCRWFARAEVEMSRDGLKVTYLGSAQA